MQSTLSISTSLFAWVAAGQEHTLPQWEGRAHWLREQIGFLHIVMMLNAFFLCSFLLTSCHGLWFGKTISLLAFSSTTCFILMTRKINMSKRSTLAHAMELFAGMQCALVCTIAVGLHIAWGGVETSRDNNVLMFSTIGPLILLQVAGTFCPDGLSLHKSLKFRGRGTCGDLHNCSMEKSWTSSSSVTSEEIDTASSGDESTGTSTCREAAGLASAVAPAAARFSGRMAPMRWVTAIRAAGAVVLAIMDPYFVPVPATVRKPWMSGIWTAWIQISMLAVHVRSTQVAPPPP
jgi:hypothetical protein